MTTTTETPSIPSNINLPSSGVQTWRIANGKICRGSEKEGTLVEYQETGREPSIAVGVVTRFSIEKGEYLLKDGTTKAYHQLEFELKTAEQDRVRFAVSLITQIGEYKPGGVACSVAWGLLHVDPDKVIAIKAVQGQQKNQFGSYPTFVNFYKVINDKGDTEKMPVRARGEESLTYEQIFNELAEKLKGHPLYKERPKKFYTENSELKAVYDCCVEHGWPNPQNAEAEWLELMNGLYKKGFQENGLKWPLNSLEEFNETLWHKVRIKFFGPDGVASMPGVLAKAKERLGSEPSQENFVDDIDPFAGE